MAWSTIRKATETDVEKLEATAKRFAKRYGIEPLEEISQTYTDAVESALMDGIYQNNQYGEWTKLVRLWHKCVERALGAGAEGIAYNYVGFHVD